MYHFFKREKRKKGEKLFKFFHKNTNIFNEKVEYLLPVLISQTMSNYFKIRIHHETTKLSDTSRKNRIRSLNTKTIMFRNV